MPRVESGQAAPAAPAGDSVLGLALNTGARLGRAFWLVDAIPSALLVAFLYILGRSGAWSGAPHLGRVGPAVSHTDVTQGVLLGAAALGVGLVCRALHPSMLRVLQGYWGLSGPARALASARVLHHRRRAGQLNEARLQALYILQQIGSDQLAAEVGEPHVPLVVAEQALGEAESMYPEDWSRILPTRLGNTIRRYEDDAGAQYALDAFTVVRHLSLLAPSHHLRFMQDSRLQLDVSVRLCMVALVAFSATFMFLIGDGPWLLAALIPYGIAYLSYRTTLDAAQEYGSALATLIDADRFLLYEHMHIPMPADVDGERAQNKKVMRLLGGSRFDTGDIRYQPLRLRLGQARSATGRVLSHRRRPRWWC
jgi:hypothetical protein